MDDEFLESSGKLLNRFLEDSTIDEQGNVEWIMKKAFIARTNDLEIFIKPLDHPAQPHFHVKSTQKHVNARFDVETFKLLTGAIISPKDYNKIVWFFTIGNPSSYLKLKEMVSRLYTKV